MDFYHGTTLRSARKIAQVGFLPNRGAVWFTKSRGYARNRAMQKARRSGSRAVVLACDIDLKELHNRLGKNHVMGGGGVIAVRGRVPPTVLRPHAMLELLVLASPEQLAAWVNKQLKLTPSNRVGPRHPGIDRLARWVDNRSTTGSSRIRPKEFLEHVRRWLPDLFEGVEIYPQDLRFDCWPKVAEVETEPPPEESDRREEKALNELTASKPKRRIRGLKLLAHLGNEDLFDWCVMSLDDESLEVRIAALHAMIHCDAAYPEVILPFAESEDKRIRAAAIAALAKHSGEEAHRWFERGLKDREACVRLEAAALLPQLDPAEHRALFELARHDPNPEIKDLAKGLTAGKGFHEMRGREHRGNEAI